MSVVFLTSFGAPAAGFEGPAGLTLKNFQDGAPFGPAVQLRRTFFKGTLSAQRVNGLLHRVHPCALGMQQRRECFCCGRIRYDSP